MLDHVDPSELAAARETAGRVDAIRAARPIGSAPAEAVLARAMALYSRGPLAPRDLARSVSRLEARLRADIPELMVERAPRSASTSPGQVAVAAHELRVAGARRREVLSLESHTVVLRPSCVLSIRGMMPGGTAPHMLARVVERDGGGRPLAAMAMGMSALWPLLLFMRTGQRIGGRGAPLDAIATPFGSGLLLARVEKVGGLPPLGLTVTTVDASGRSDRILHDWFADGGERLWVDTRTFVGADLMSPPQAELRERLLAFGARYPDVLADAGWRWRIGLGQEDEAVDAVARAFRLRPLAPGRGEEALAALETIVGSDLWVSEATTNARNQARSKRRRRTAGSRTAR